MPNQRKPAAPQETTENMLQILMDGFDLLDEHLDHHPRSLDNVRWVAREGDYGCRGAAVVVALIEKKASKLKTRVMKGRL